MLFCPIGKMKTFTTGYLCGKNSASTQRGGGRTSVLFSFNTFTQAKVVAWCRAQSEAITPLEDSRNLSFQEQNPVVLIASNPVFVKKPGFIAKGFWVLGSAGPDEQPQP